MHRISMFVGLGAGALVLAGLALAAGEPARSGRGARRGPEPLIGKPAPDFELPVLKEETDETGQTVNRITDEKVKLSSLRGRKTVVLFMSSYT